MAIRRTRTRLLVLTAIAGLLGGLFGLTPAANAVVSPTLTLFRGETLANNGETDTNGLTNRLKATLVILTPPGVTVSQMRRQSGSASAALTAYGAVEGTVRVIDAGAGNNYSIVEANFPAGNCGCFAAGTRVSNRTARVDIKMSDGTELINNTWGYQSRAESNSGGNEDPPTMFALFDTTSNAVVSPGGSLKIHYQCDDKDSEGAWNGTTDDECDNVIIRVRNVATNTGTFLKCVGSTGPGCENDFRFNADDNTERSYTAVPLSNAVTPLARGRYVIEGWFCNEADRGTNHTLCTGNLQDGWQNMGSFYYNDAAPTASLASTFTGGGTGTGPLRPFTDAKVNYTATISSDGQVASWDLDNNGSFETVEYGESTDTAGGPTLSAAQKTKSVDTTGKTEGTSCAVNLQVEDNGGLNAADPTNLFATVASPVCTVNRRPTGQVQTVQAHQGVGLPIALNNGDGDGDPRTCATTSPTKGTLSGGTTCTRTYTPIIQPNTTDSFTYTVSDDHGGTSVAYLVTINIVNQTPTATAQNISVDAGLATAITLAGTDPDGDTLTCSAGLAGKGAITGSNCALSYTSNAGPANNGVGGNDSFTFTVNDPTGPPSAPATVGITIRNPDLSLTKSHVGRFNPGTGAGTYTLTLANTNNSTANGTTTITDTLPSGMTYRSYSAGTSGFTCTGTPGVSTTVTCTRSSQIPKPFSGSLTITVDVAANAASPVNNMAVISSLYELSSTAANNTAVDATNVNHKPTAGDLTVTTDVDVPVSVTLPVSDPDNDPLTFTILTGPSSGSLSGSGASRLYFPDSGFVGIDTFTYRVTDDNALSSDIATVKIYVGVSPFTGLVTNEVGGAGLANIKVYLIDNSVPTNPDPALLATGTTDATGAYDLGPQFPSGAVPFGDYVLRFVDPLNNFISEYYNNVPNRPLATNISVSSANPTIVINAALTPGARIQGTVRSTANGSPTVDGIQVRLYKIGDPGSKASTTSNGGGYKFELLTAGSYQLWFRDVNSGQWVSEWYDEQTSQANAATISVTVGQQIVIDEDLVPVIIPPPPVLGTVAGTVRTTAIGNAPLAGIQVRLYPEPYTTSAAATTDANGQYSFANQPAGNYKIWFRVVTGNAYVSEYYNDRPDLSTADVVTVTAGTVVANAQLTPVAPQPPPNSAIISGTVTQIDGITPISGIQVRLYVNGVATGSVAATTDANGTYSFTNRAPGQYQVWFRDVSNKVWFSEWNIDKPDQASADPVTATNGQSTTVNASLVAKS